MRYETMQGLSEEDFKRSTFDKLSRADQLLLTLMLTLMYWREYSTAFHIGLTYSISEATVCRTIRKIEAALIKSKQFHLPGRRMLYSSGAELAIVLVDVTEQQVACQKKTGPAVQRQKAILHGDRENNIYQIYT